MYNSLGSSRAALTAAQCLDRAEQAEQLAKYRSDSEDSGSYLAEASFWRAEAMRRTAPLAGEARSFSAPPTLETAATDSVVLAS